MMRSSLRKREANIFCDICSERAFKSCYRCVNCTDFHICNDCYQCNINFAIPHISNDMHSLELTKLHLEINEV